MARLHRFRPMARLHRANRFRTTWHNGWLQKIFKFKKSFRQAKRHCIAQTLKNKEIVCAIKYEDTEKIKYSIKDFSSAIEAVQNGYIVTH